MGFPLNINLLFLIRALNCAKENSSSRRERLHKCTTFTIFAAMRKIITYKHYFSDFISTLSKDEYNKIRRALDLFKVENKFPRHYIKYIRDGLYEFRVNYGNNEFRIFFIYDGDTLVILFNAFKKKTQKTPENEIKKAIKLKEEGNQIKGGILCN